MSEPLPPAPPPPGAPPAPPAAAGARPGNPWDRRHELGFLPALVGAIQQFAVAPTRTFDDTRETGDYGGPLLFALLVGWLSVVVSQLWNLALRSFLGPMVPPELAEQLGPFFAGGMVSFFFSVLIAPLYIVVGTFVVAGILHLCLMVVGGLASSRSRFEGTFRVVCFASVANLAQIVPLAGGLLAMVWWLVLGTIGLSSLHRTSQGKALLAILIPLILCCVCAILGAVLFGASIAALVAGASGAGG
ncbi:MAG: YIP1 family protein [Thermoanaerobaculia bacterium]|nr:YIP1 family protein [Thermoanaerobaculia bacterium]